MAYDEQLATRIRALIGDTPDVTEKNRMSWSTQRTRTWPRCAGGRCRDGYESMRIDWVLTATWPFG